MPSKEFELLFIIDAQFYTLKVQLSPAEQKELKKAAYWEIAAKVTTLEGETVVELRTPAEWLKPVGKFNLASASAITAISAGAPPVQLKGGPQVEHAELLGAVPGAELPSTTMPASQQNQVSFAINF